MEALTLYRQLISFASAPIYANTAGEPLDQLGGEKLLPNIGWNLRDGVLRATEARSWHGQLSPEPGAPGPVAPTGVMPVLEALPNTGYMLPLPERASGRIIQAEG